MDIIKIIVIGFISVIIIILLKQYKPEFSLYVSLLAGALILLISFDKISGIVSLIQSLASRTSLGSEFLGILLKVTGIAILTEFAVSICKDAGESAIAGKIDMGGKICMIAISIPVISSLLNTISSILP